MAYSIDLDYAEIDPEVRHNTLAALEVFRKLGAIITEVHPRWTSDLLDDCYHWYNTMDFGRQTIWHAKNNAALMTDYALYAADFAQKHTGIDDVHKVPARAHQMYQTMGPMLAAHDVFICPNNSVPAVKADHDPTDQSFTVNGKKADPEYGWILSHHFNMLHNLPVLAVPSGHAKNGVPTGIQIVARSYDDARVFKTGLAYEKAMGGWYTANNKRPAI